jgi:uncharacterized peroxidase-related enzyme
MLLATALYENRKTVMSSWIRIVQPEEADEELRQVYNEAQSPHGTVDNVMKVHSLQPKTMLGHLQLYRSILHNPDMTLPVWFLEVVASYTSIVNKCEYSLAHHFRNARRLLDDDERADKIYECLEGGKPAEVFDGKELVLLEYAAKLTAHVGAMVRTDIQVLRDAGCDDREILEVNQVVAYFNYSNRVLNGLGVTTDGDVVGYYA